MWPDTDIMEDAAQAVVLSGLAPSDVIIHKSTSIIDRVYFYFLNPGDVDIYKKGFTIQGKVDRWHVEIPFVENDQTFEKLIDAFAHGREILSNLK